MPEPVADDDPGAPRDTAAADAPHECVRVVLDIGGVQVKPQCNTVQPVRWRVDAEGLARPRTDGDLVTGLEVTLNVGHGPFDVGVVVRLPDFRETV